MVDQRTAFVYIDNTGKGGLISEVLGTRLILFSAVYLVSLFFVQ